MCPEPGPVGSDRETHTGATPRSDAHEADREVRAPAAAEEDLDDFEIEIEDDLEDDADEDEADDGDDVAEED